MNAVINERFTMTGHKCECLIDTTHDENGNEQTTLKIRSIPNAELLFAYVPGNGLVTLNGNTGAIAKENVLGVFAGIEDGDRKKLTAFFENFGFLFPIGSEHYESFDFDDLFAVQRRVRVALDLMNDLQSPRTPYKKILSTICWLTFAKRIELDSSNERVEPFRTCLHGYNDFLAGQKTGRYDNLHYDPYGQNEKDVPDTVNPPYTRISMTDIEKNAWISASNESQHVLSKYAASIIFISENGVQESDRHVIDYFFHLTQSMGELSSVGRGPEDVQFECGKGEVSKNLSDELRKSSLEVAKIILKEEMDYAINAIVPSYDTKTMSPSWKIPDLYTALFFSIFYMRPGLEIYRKCENPNCGLYFLVSTTNSRRKYCSYSCSNAMQQRKIRQRKKKASTQTDAWEPTDV